MASEPLGILERAFRRECSSLAQYLADCRPWADRGDRPVEDLVRSIMADERRWAEQLAGLIEQRGGVPLQGSYPTEFTDTHFLSLEFMLRRLDDNLARNLAQLEGEVKQLVDDGEARSLLERMIERKRGQVQAIGKLRASARPTQGVASS